MSLIYEAVDLRKSYGAQRALFMPRFELAQGEAAAITGPNGSGKSTLLRILAFLEHPTSGELRFFGGSPRLDATLLLQEPYLFKETVFRNVTLGLLLRGRRENLEGKYAKAMADAGFMDAAAFRRRHPGQLSGGEKQRVALASRLILNPAALLLDEPTSNVDQKSAEIIGAALKRYLKYGGSLVCATHSPDLAAMLGCREWRLTAPDQN